MKIVIIVLLCIIWYLIIGAFVSAGAFKIDKEDIYDEDNATIRIGIMLLWPFMLIYILVAGIGYVLSKLPAGAYNLMNKPKKEKKEATTIYDDYDDHKPKYKNTTMTTTPSAWYCDENGEIKREDAIITAYKKMCGNAEIFEIMEAIDKATDECEKKYGIKIKEATDIFCGENGRTYIDFVADNGRTYCLEIPVPIKDWRRRRELFRGCDKYKE